jgi:hypothetical protein
MPNLIGTAPDQVPVNGFLGNMAFQNKEGVVTDLLSTTALTVTGAASFAGTIAAGLGSAAAPSYTFTGDTNTGIFSPGADTIAFSEGGVEAMRIDSSANVGIGTSSPTAKLDVRGTSYVIGAGGTRVTDAVGENGFEVVPAATNNVLSYNRTTNGYLPIRWRAGVQSWEVDNVERMRITATGAVGIGTTTPNRRLTIGDAGVLGINSSGNTLQSTLQHAAGGLDIYAGGASYVAIGTNSSERMRITDTGNVGIGTSSPTGRLQVSGTGYILNNANADPAGGVTIPNVAGTFLTYNRSAGLVDSEIIYGNTVNSFLRFTSQSAAGVLTERMRVNSAGDVGVGVAPSAWGSTYRALEVRTGAIYDTPAGTSSGFTFNAYFNGTNWLYKGTGGNATALRYEQGGAGHQWFSAPSGAGGATVSFTNTMVLNGSGNVGIGTGLPITRLHLSQSNTGDYASVVLLSNSADTAADRTGIYGSPASGTANPYRGGITFHPGATGAVSIHTGNNATPSAGERVRIDGTNGFVGIATTAPDNLLTLGTSAANQGVALKQSTITVARFALVNPGVDNTPYIGSISNNAFAFWANNAERMRILSDGNVGIGTSSAATKLDVSVAGGMLRVGGASGNNLIQSYTGGGSTAIGLWSGGLPRLYSTGDMYFSVGATVGTASPSAYTDAMVITSAGNVGIGTTSPATTLHARKDAAGGTTYAIYTDNGSGGAGTNVAGIGFANGGFMKSSITAAVYNNDFLAFNVGGSGTTERMRIDASGNVGIGTSSPGQKLSVAGSAIVTLGNSYFCYTNDYGIGTPDSNGLQVFASNGDVLRFGHRTGGTTFTEDMRIASNGNVGIGTTSPATKFVVSNGGAGGLEFDTNGLIQSYNRSTSAYQFMYFDAAQILFRPSGTERMRIDASGNVGIGTSAPISKFQVGTGYITSGSASSTNGARIIAGQWSGSDHLTTFGSEYSSGGPVLGYAVWPSTSATGSFISAAAAALQRGAYTISGNLHIWYGGGSQAVAVGSAVTTSERMRIDASGNVGIGTNAPATKLEVNGAITSSGSTNPYLALNNGTATSYVQVSSGALDVRVGGANPITFNTNSAERMRIDSSGNVGIGTSAPGSFKLNVQGNAYTTTIAVGTDENLLYQSAANNLGFRVGTSTNTAYLNIKAASGVPQLDGAGGVLAFGTAGTERARISSAGGFSVGTTADPGAGAIFATGNITAYYSDDRLKTRLGSIDDALGIIDKIDAFYYEANETAKELGYEAVREVGVSAQSVQRVLPEVVAPAPIDAEYLTVRYERLVPVLIQAIKELTARVAQLEGN